MSKDTHNHIMNLLHRYKLDLLSEKNILGAEQVDAIEVMLKKIQQMHIKIKK